MHNQLSRQMYLSKSRIALLFAVFFISFIGITLVSQPPTAFAADAASACKKFKKGELDKCKAGFQAGIKEQNSPCKKLSGGNKAACVVGFTSGKNSASPSPPPSSVVPSSVSKSSLPQTDANSTTIKKILSIVFGIVGALAFLVIIISGLRYVLAGGDAQKTAKAKEGIIYALVGLAIALTAQAIVSFVVGRV